MELESRHQCLIYEGAPSKQLRTLAIILQRKLDEGYRCLYLNSPPMIAGMRSTLAAMGIDVSSEIAKARLILSADTVVPGKDFESNVMLGKLEDTLDQALSDGYEGLWATGDMSWEFGHKNNFSKLLEYEWGLEDLFKKRKQLCGVCQYHQDTLPQESLRQGLVAHPAILINDTLSRINPHYLQSTKRDNVIPFNYELDKTILELFSLP